MKQREETAKLIQEMEEQGVIEPLRSPWESPMALVNKKNRMKRFCIAYRKLNAITERDSYPLPRGGFHMYIGCYWGILVVFDIGFEKWVLSGEDGRK